jgi:uncharacterized protein YndB with AHSA1/START domain
MDDIVIEHIYPYSMEQVWEALTDPAALAEWLMPGDFKPIVGHKVEFRCEPKGGFDGTVQVEVLEVAKPRKLSYSWKTNDMKRPTIVTYFLSPTADGGTHLRLEHKGFDPDNGPISFPLFKQGWPGKIQKDLPNVIQRICLNRRS